MQWENSTTAVVVVFNTQIKKHLAKCQLQYLPWWCSAHGCCLSGLRSSETDNLSSPMPIVSTIVFKNSYHVEFFLIAPQVYNALQSAKQINVLLLCSIDSIKNCTFCICSFQILFDIKGSNTRGCTWCPLWPHYVRKTAICNDKRITMK